MRPQALGLGQALRSGSVREQALGRIANDARALNELLHRKRIGEHGRAAGRQRVVGAGNIIAERLGAPSAHKDGTGVADAAKQAHRILAVQLQVLGRHGVHRLDGSGHVGGHHDGALIVERSTRNLGTRRLRYQNVDTRLDLARKLLVAGHQIAGCQRIVFGLGHQVGRDHHGLGRGIGQHTDLGGAGDHVDTHVARDNLLGRSDKGVARAGDLVDARNGLGAVRQRGHGLSAAHHIDLVHAAELGCRERIRANQAVLLRRRHHDHALDAGDLGGNGIHKHGGRILRATARHVDADRRERGHLNAEHRAVRTRGKPTLLDLALVELADLACSFLQRGDKGRIETFERGIDLLLRQAEALQLNAIKTLAIIAHRGIAVDAHVGHDIAGGVDDVLWQHALAVELVGNEALTGSKLDGLHFGIPYRLRLRLKNEMPGGGASRPAARTLGRPCVLSLLCRARDGLKMLVLHGRGQAIGQVANARIQASGTRIDKEARRAVHNATSNNQVVIAQRGARGSNVHDTVGHTDDGAQLDVTV